MKNKLRVSQAWDRELGRFIHAEAEMMSQTTIFNEKRELLSKLWAMMTYLELRGAAEIPPETSMAARNNGLQSFLNLTLAEAIEVLVQTYGPMKRKAILGTLREVSFPMSKKNDRVLVWTAVRMRKDLFKVEADYVRARKPITL